MISLLPLSWALLVALAAWRHRPESRRLADRLGLGPLAGSDQVLDQALDPLAHPVRQGEPRIADSLSRVGQLVTDRLPPFRALPQLWVGIAALVLAAVVPWAPLTAMVLCGSTLAGGAWSQRRQRWRSARAQAEQMVALLQVLSLTVSAGATLRTSLAAAAERVGPPLGPALVGVRRQLESGATVTEALDRLSVGLAAEHRVVIERIRSAELTGAPLGSLLRTSAQSLAERRRRDAEVRARRLPVFMVLPLVCCVLPAFVVLAIVPMVVSGGSSLFPL